MPPPGSCPRRPEARSWSPRPCGTRSGRREGSRSWTAGSTGCAGSPTAGGCTRPSGDATTPSGRPRPRSSGATGSGPTCAGRSRTPGSGHGSFVLVAGEAGVGKTRLLQEIDAEADANGLRVLTGHSAKDEGQAPYLPFTEMIEQGMVTPRSPATLRHALGEAAAEIARIAPALRLVVPEIPAPLDLPPEQARSTCGSGRSRVHRRAPPNARSCSCSRTCTGPKSRPCCCSSTCPNCRNAV